MARLDINRFAQGALIGVLGICLLLAGVALQWLRPHFTKSVEAELTAVASSDKKESTDMGIKVPVASTVVGESLGSSNSVAGWQEVELPNTAAGVRLPAGWKTEQKPGGLYSLAGDGVTIDVLVVQDGNGSLEERVGELADQPDTLTYIGQERGIRAHGDKTLVIGFEGVDTQVLLSVVEPGIEELKLYEAIAASLSWKK